MNKTDLANHIDSAIEYVKDSVEYSRISIAQALMGNMNCELVDCDESLNEIIIDLMEEYGQENGLPEGWWESECYTDDIVWRIG